MANHVVALQALVDTFDGDFAAAMRALKAAVPKVDKHAAVNKSLDDAVIKCDPRMSRKMFKKLALAAWDRTHPSTEEVKPRKPNAWFIFRDANMTDVKANNPTMTREERLKTLSEMYKASKVATEAVTSTQSDTTQTDSAAEPVEPESVMKRKRSPEAFTIRTRARIAKPVCH
jgi:hypothetical protein